MLLLAAPDLLLLDEPTEGLGAPGFSLLGWRVRRLMAAIRITRPTDAPPTAPALPYAIIVRPMSAIYDLFLSYRTHHAARVDPLIEALAAHGVRVWRDVDRLQGGTAITGALRQGLAASRALAVYATADLADSAICIWELASAWIAAERRGQAHQRVLLLHPPDLGDLRRLHFGPLRDNRAFDLAGRSLEDIAQQIAAHLAACDPSPLGALLDLESAPRWFPGSRSGSNHFVGRLFDLWDLHGRLLRSRQVGVTGHVGHAIAQVRGLGGVGKTLFVLEYARRFEAAWPGGIFWFDADKGWGTSAEPPVLLARRHHMLAALASPLGAQVVPGDLAATAFVVETALREHTGGRPYLWILDNIPPGTTQRAIDALMPPDGHGALLLTTRWRGLGSLGEHLDLDVLDAGSAWNLLTRESPPRDSSEDAAARNVARDVGHHPLALDILRALIPDTAVLGAPYATWERRLADPRGDALDDAAEELAEELPTGRARAISAVLADSLEQRSELALDVLRLASLLADDPIPGDLIADTFALPDDDRRPSIERAIAELATHALVSRVSDVPGIHVHALVRRVVRRWHNDQLRLLALAERARECMHQRFKAIDTVDHRTHPLLLPLLPHARVLADGPTVPAATLGVDVGMILDARGDFAGARSCFEHANTTLEHLRGPEDPTTLGTLQNLAGSLSELGDLAGANLRYTQVLTARQRLLGPEHRDTLGAQQNLALTLWAQGDLESARTLYEDALTVAERVLGINDKDTLTIAFNLANTLHAQGNLSGARDRLELVLDAMAHSFGPEHPRTIGALSNLAGVLADQGDMDGAKKYYQQALAVDKRDRGPEHPDTLRVIQNLAGVLHAQGDRVGARKLEEEALILQEQRFGPDHPNTLMSRQNLAVTLERQGDFPAAREHASTALFGLQRTLGEDHPKSIIAMHNLAVIAKAQGDLPAARRLEEDAHSRIRSKLGPDHPWTLTVMHQLAEIMTLQNDLSAAQALFLEVLPARQRILGADHPDTLSTLHSLAGPLLMQGDIDGAREYGERALEGMERILGPDHPDTSLARFTLAMLLRRIAPSLAVPHILRLNAALDRPAASLSAVERDIKIHLSKLAPTPPAPGPHISRRRRRPK